MSPIAVGRRNDVAVVGPDGMEHWKIGRVRVENPVSVLEEERWRGGNVNVITEEGNCSLLKHRQVGGIHLQLLGLIRVVKRVDSEQIAGDSERGKSWHSWRARR